MPPQNPSGRLERIHRDRLEQIRNDALGVAGAANKIAQSITQVLENGGTIETQRQMHFITGAYARMLKDFGVVEQLQKEGATQKKPMR